MEQHEQTGLAAKSQLWVWPKLFPISNVNNQAVYLLLRLNLGFIKFNAEFRIGRFWCVLQRGKNRPAFLVFVRGLKISDCRARVQVPSVMNDFELKLAKVSEPFWTKSTGTALCRRTSHSTPLYAIQRKSDETNFMGLRQTLLQGLRVVHEASRRRVQRREHPRTFEWSENIHVANFRSSNVSPWMVCSAGSLSKYAIVY